MMLWFESSSEVQLKRHSPAKRGRENGTVSGVSCFTYRKHLEARIIPSPRPCSCHHIVILAEEAVTMSILIMIMKK